LGVYNATNNRILPQIDLSKIPDSVGEWKSKEVNVDKKVFDILQTSSVLIKEYVNPLGDSVFLTIVYYKAHRVEFHSPERCAVGQGSYISEIGKEDLFDSEGNKLVAANKLLVKGDQRVELILYYFESEGFITGNYLRLRLHMIMNKLQNKPNSGALIKFSALVNHDISATNKVLNNFIRLIVLDLTKYLSG